MSRFLISFSTLFAMAMVAAADEPVRVLDHRLRHLRIDGPREWSEFSEQPDANQLELRFQSDANQSEWTLGLRQQDVKQTWDVLVNEQPLGRLVRDENDMQVYFALPAGSILKGENQLQIRQQQQATMSPDDIRVGTIKLYPRARTDILNASTLECHVTDDDSGTSLPARITITDLNGTLQSTGAKSNDHLAVRPGIVYTSTGKARIGLPGGMYKIYAGRGFEYSLDSAEITLADGDQQRKTFKIRREVPTNGFVACDTHVHTLTHSGHGDASVEERMITLAAEGIELPIATDHNVQIDHRPFAQKMDVRQFFTPVIGNEVTTSIGHFNIFPVNPGARVPDHKLETWKSILDDIYRTPGVKVAILNHARDLHRGVRPFGQRLFNEVVGENLDGWAMQFNAMEVVNSSATQTDHLRLFQDWMALLNRGYDVTPVGSSDSHDVGRHFVGQGRTYIRCDDSDPGAIDVDNAVNALLQGRALVSYGLLAEIKVDSKYAAGELAPVPNNQVKVDVRVLGPHWVSATQVRLYSNGLRIRVIDIPMDAGKSLPVGVKWQGEWSLPRPRHDVHLVAIATGPGIDEPYWKTAKPYQPRSPEWEPRLIGCSGAVWLDVDGDGRKTATYDYARRLFAESGGDLSKLVELLAGYDRAVGAQAAHLCQKSGISLLTPRASELLNSASDHVKTGFWSYLDAWRKNQIARSSRAD